MSHPRSTRICNWAGVFPMGSPRMARIGELVRLPRIPEALFVQRPDLAHVDREMVTSNCPVCGLVLPREVQFGQPAQTGYLRRACACEISAREERELQRLAEERQAIRLRRAYNWLDVQQNEVTTMTFEGFDAVYQPQAFEQALQYANRLKGDTCPFPNLILAGNVGTGKTHLACAILNEFCSSGPEGLFTTAQDLFNALYAADFEKKQQRIKQASMTALLVLDDLDKLYVRQETDGAFQKHTLFDLLDRRYKCRLPTIITTNEQKDLGRWLDRATLSRLLGHVLALAMNGQDYRRAKR